MHNESFSHALFPCFSSTNRNPRKPPLDYTFRASAPLSDLRQVRFFISFVLFELQIEKSHQLIFFLVVFFLLRESLAISTISNSTARYKLLVSCFLIVRSRLPERTADFVHVFRLVSSDATCAACTTAISRYVLLIVLPLPWAIDVNTKNKLTSSEASLVPLDRS